MRAKNILTALSCCLLLLSCKSIPAFAEVTLPEGAVKGLPERLAALDSEGNAVNSATGEYFFHVENMQYGVTYSKDVQLMNLREDESYYIYFYVEPLYKAGEIDLEKGCTCTFYLDGVEFYKGDVNGKGNIDLSNMYYPTGYYAPGDSHVLRAEVVWNDLDVMQHVDNGHRLVDKDGTHVLVGPDPSGYAEGEIEFKWIFFASVFPASYDEPPTEPTSEPFGDETVATDATEPTGDVSEETDATDPDPTEIKDATETVPTETDPQQTDFRYPTETTTTTEPAPNSHDDFWGSPITGYLAKDGKVWLIGMGVVASMIAVLLVLIHRDKHKRDKK